MFFFNQPTFRLIYLEDYQTYLQAMAVNSNRKTLKFGKQQCIASEGGAGGVWALGRHRAQQQQEGKDASMSEQVIEGVTKA